MTQWWNALSLMQQIVFVIACATTLFMLGQIVMMLIGFGESDVDADAGDIDVPDTDAPTLDVDPGHPEGDGGFRLFGLKIFTVRSIIAFFCIGSWVAFTMEYFLRWPLALLIGIVAGLAAGLLMAYVMHALMKLQSSGNIDVTNSVGAEADVYLTVPAHRESRGKINLTLQERFVELEAVTDCEEPLETGTRVRVVEALDEETVRVEPLGDKTRLSPN